MLYRTEGGKVDIVEIVRNHGDYEILCRSPASRNGYEIGKFNAFARDVEALEKGFLEDLQIVGQKKDGTIALIHGEIADLKAVAELKNAELPNMRARERSVTDKAREAANRQWQRKMAEREREHREEIERIQTEQPEPRASQGEVRVEWLSSQLPDG